MKAALFFYLSKGISLSDHESNPDYELLRIYKREKPVFTQGLYWHEGRLLESGGMYGISSLSWLELEEGEGNQGHARPVQSTLIEPKYFAEGITLLDDTVYMLTWQEKKILTFDL